MQYGGFVIKCPGFAGQLRTTLGPLLSMWIMHVSLFQVSTMISSTV